MTRKALKSVPVVQTAPLLIVSGQFFVFTVREVQVHVLDARCTALLYDGLSIAETRSERNVDMHRAYVVRQTFGRDAIGFLPAGTTEALFYYCEHYEGPFSETIKGLSACILTGTPFGHDDANRKLDGGLKVQTPSTPLVPTPSSGMHFEKSAVA